MRGATVKAKEEVSKRVCRKTETEEKKTVSILNLIWMNRNYGMAKMCERLLANIIIKKLTKEKDLNERQFGLEKDVAP